MSHAGLGRAYVFMHISVALWGLTAILGKTVLMSSTSMVIWRMAGTAILLGCSSLVWKHLRKMDRSLILRYASLGAILAMHWLTFYRAVKISSASLGVLCMAFAPVFLSFLEPVLLKTHFKKSDLLFACACLPGFLLVLGHIPVGHGQGAWIGLVSAVFLACFTALNKKYVERSHFIAISFVEMAFGSLLLVLIGLVFWPGQTLQIPDEIQQWILLALFVLGCTLLPFLLSMVALRSLSAFSVQLIVNLEIIYALVLSVFILAEHKELNQQFYFGAVIIIASVLGHPIYQKLKHQEPLIHEIE